MKSNEIASFSAAHSPSYVVNNAVHLMDEQKLAAFRRLETDATEARSQQFLAVGVSLVALEVLTLDVPFTAAEREHIKRGVSAAKKRGGSHASIDLATVETLIREAKPAMKRLEETLAEAARAAATA